MARKKKNSHPITIRMEQVLYDRLEEYCKRSGQPKTVALERALTNYIDKYDNDRKQPEESSKKQFSIHDAAF